MFFETMKLFWNNNSDFRFIVGMVLAYFFIALFLDILHNIERDHERKKGK